MLSDKHYAEWKASGVADEIIERNVWTIEDSWEVDRLLNRNTKNRRKHSDHLVPCWAVKGIDPLRSWDTWYGIQVKPDNPPLNGNGKPRKYLCPSDEEAQPLFLDPGGEFWAEVLQDPSRPLVITEGAKKAGAVLSLGIACVSIPGVWNGQKEGTLHDRLKAFCQVGRTVYLCFDNDLLTKDGVKLALERLGRLISAEGAVVRIVQIPDGPLKGIDDYLAAHPEGDRLALLQELLDRAIAFEAWRKPLQEKRQQIESGRCKLAERYLLTKQILGDRLRLNELTSELELNDQPFDLDDLILALAVQYDLHLPDNQASKIVMNLARANAYNPVKDYLEEQYRKYGENYGLLNQLATKYLGADSPLFNAFIAKTLIAAVARAFKPGSKVDTVLILQGKQGLGKSSFFKVLASPAWFDDSLGSVSDKDERLKLHKVWFVEWAELEAIFKRKDIAAVKSFVSSTSDLIRPPYGREVKRFERKSIIVGSTNQDDFLGDPTGNRRFWIVPCAKEIDLELLSSDRDRIWAAAVAAYKAGQPWWLDTEEQSLADEVNETFVVRDPWEDAIASYCECRSTVTTSEILADLLRIDLEKRTRADEMRVASILKSLGWISHRVGQSRRRSWIKV
ncbi:virulence-associated E family protein [Thermosynechococcus sp. FA-CM-4201]